MNVIQRDFTKHAFFVSNRTNNILHYLLKIRLAVYQKKNIDLVRNICYSQTYIYIARQLELKIFWRVESRKWPYIFITG
jgi:hypothetical protein